MKVKLIYDDQDYKQKEQILELQSIITEDDIKSLFPVIFKTDYNDNCSYEVLEGKIITESEMLAYSE